MSVPLTRAWGVKIFWQVGEKHISRKYLNVSKICWDPTYAQMVWPKTTKFDTVHEAYRSVSRGLATLQSQDGGAPVSPIFGSPLTSKFGITHVGSSVLLGHQPRPRPKVVGPQRLPPPKKKGTYYMCAHSMRNSNHIFHGDQAMCGKCLHGQRMLTGDFCGSYITLCFTYSVCPSVQCRQSIPALSKRIDISSHFWHSSRGVILVFLAPPPLQNSSIWGR